MTEPDIGTHKVGSSDLGRRYTQAVDQYLTLAGVFAPDAPVDLQQLEATLNKWFQTSLLGDGADLLQHWAGFGESVFGQHGERLRRAVECSVEYQRLQGRLTTFWSSIAQAAAHDFARRFGADFAGKSTRCGADHWYAQWIELAEGAYTAAAQTSEYSALIAELSNAAYVFKAEQGALSELWAKHFNHPTRSEINALYLQLRELRGQIRELRQRLNLSDDDSGAN